MSEKKFLATSRRKELTNDEREIFTTEAVIAKENPKIQCIAFCGYSDVTEADIKYVMNISKKICAFVGEKLNEFHKVDFSREEWKLLLFRDIQALVQVAFEKYRKILGLQSDAFYIYGFERNPIVPLGVWDGSIICEDDYNVFMYTVICKELGFEVIYKDLCEIERAGSRKCDYGGIAKTFIQKIKRVINDPKTLLRWGKRFIHGTQVEIPKIKNCKSLLVRTRIPQNVEDSMLKRHPNDLQRLQVELLWGKTVEIAKKYSVDSELRARLFDSNSLPPSEDPFESICFKIVLQSICVSAIEAFDEIHAEAKRIAECVNVEKIYTSSCMFVVCFLENLCGVYLRKEGAKCYEIQHSASEALSEYELAMFREIGFDGELTWGWTREFKGFEYKPRCINRTPECKQSESVDKDPKRILVIASTMEDYNAGFFNYSQIEEKYFQFLDCLNPNLYPHVVVRVRESTDTEFCKKHQKYKGIHLETIYEIPYEESVKKSGLVISTYYSACHVEAMCTGVPCVMFECFTCCVVNPVMLGITDKLKDVGIYYEDGKQAADFVSELQDYEEWWQKKEVQEACVSYLKLVVGDYKKLSQIWETEFMADC